jgi:hypothetical protein
MKGTKARPEIPATEAAIRLRVSRERVVRLVQIGRLPGRRDPELGWMIEVAALERLSASLARAQA